MFQARLRVSGSIVLITRENCVALRGLPSQRLFFLLLSLPFFRLFDFDLDIIRFIPSFSFVYYAVTSVSVSAATRLAYDTVMYFDTYAGLTFYSYFCLGYTICFRYRVYYLLFLFVLLLR